MSVFQKLLDTIKIRGACYVILIDPDKKNDESIYDQVEKANRSDVDAIFVGGSLMMDGKSNDRVEKIKQLFIFITFIRKESTLFNWRTGYICTNNKGFKIRDYSNRLYTLRWRHSYLCRIYERNASYTYG